MVQRTVVDADGHVEEPESMWAEYLEPEFRHLAPRYVVDNEGRRRRYVGGELAHFLPLPPGDHHPAREGGHDPKARLADMDSEGIDVSVLFTTVGLRFAGLRDPRVCDALCRAYNRWLADFCAADPRRLVGVGVLPQSDIGLAVVEARRVVEEHGFRAVMLRPNPILGRNLDDPSYEPLWATIEELGVPAVLHEGTTLDIVQSGADRFENFLFRHACSHPHEHQYALLSLICGGVLERHADLRVLLVESGCGWLPYWLERLDGHLDDWGHASLPLPLRASDYFARQCMITCEPRERTVPAVIDLLGDDGILFATDYPHPDGIFPGVVAALADREDISEVSKAKILGTNAITCFGLG